MTTYNIVSRHAKLSEAVAAAGIDLSYNEPLARSDLARDDRDAAIKQALVLEVGGEKSVWFEYHCDIKLLNRYEPFFKCLHDRLFRPVHIAEQTVNVGEPCIRRGRESRKQIAKYGFTVTT